MIYVTEYLVTRRSRHNKKPTTNWNISMLILRAADEYNIPGLELLTFGWIKEDDIMVPIHGNVYVASMYPYNMWHVVAN